MDQNEVSRNFKEYCEAWLKLYKGNSWVEADIPADASSYVYWRMFFDRAKFIFQKFYDDGADKDKLKDLCLLIINELKLDLANPYNQNDNLLKYQIEGWKGILSFIDLFQSVNLPNISSVPLHNSGPVFKEELVPTIYELLKDFFVPEQRSQLHALLVTGKKIDTPLLFLDRGNRLADAFKQLIKSDIITGCDQKELELWIRDNFIYLNKRNKVATAFKLRYLNDIISTNKDKCQHPLLNVKMDKVTGVAYITKA